ncbi:MAG: alpha-2-macroglobulin, partial [Planctomycetaceae bacterium]|nr:alpha-2-macroglobulin [Planctomycetaceae bacterium]
MCVSIGKNPGSGSSPLWGLLMCCLLTGCLSAEGVPVQSHDESRKQAQQLFADGNFAEALGLYQRLSLDAGNSGKALAEDFGQTVDCFNRLNRVNEFDAFVEAAVTTHAGDWRLLKRAAESLQGQVDQNGFLVAGEFHRGHHRGGGEWVSSSNRDRVRALQLLLQAEPLLNADDSAAASERSVFYQQLANTVRNIGNGESWRLQDLTDTAVLPDYDKNAGGYYGRFGGFGGSSGGAPVDENGQPVFHQLPESWAAAKSDGERWRWAMNMAIQVDRSRTSELELQWALFLLNEFGVQTADYVSPPVVILRGDEPADDDQQTPEDADTHAVHLLPDSETVARLVNGTKRFTLPDEYNHITVLKRIAARNDSYRRQALETLVGVRMARHQYPQAAALLKDVLPLATAGDDRDNVQRQIDQIEKNWVQFESARTQVAGSGAVIDVRFRNGSEIAFSARPIDVSQLLRDTMTYLQSRPQELDHQKIQIEHIGHRLIQEGQEKYLGPPTANWSLTVQQPELHFDGVQTVTTPLQQPGAYWLTAKMKDGNEARVVIWVADTTITRKRVEDGTLYFIADAESGSPVANADLEFFGWRQEFIRDGRRYELYTKRFADRANGDGLCVPAADQLENRFQWLSIVRTKDGRLAYDGFNRIWNPDRIDVLSYSPTKVYTITDRPVYRPGHTVKFRQWVRRPKFHDDTADFADRDYWIQIRNPKGDIVHEVKARTDRWAGIDGEWTLPVDATLGHYTLAVAEEVTVNRRRRQPPNPRPNVPPPLPQPETVEKRIIGQGTFRVEEYRKPEFEVTIDAPDKPVMLGEKIQAKVNARYYFGAPVAEGTVHYKVERTPKDSRWYPVARWDWLYSPGYWWFAPDYNWYPGWYRWGCLAPIPPWRGWHPDPPEVVVEGDAELQPDGTFLIDIDTAQALADHSDSDHNYSITAEVVDQSRRTIIGSGSVLVAREPYKVFVWTDRGHYRTGDTVNVGIQARTPDGKGVSASGKVSLLSVTYGDDNKPVEQEVSAFDVATDDSGAANLKLVMPSAGQYRVRVSLTDGEGHQQEGGYVLFVRGPNADGRGYRFNDLELITEKREYQPGETVTLQVNTNKTDGTVLLFVRPVNGLCPKPVVLKLNGKSTTFDVNIQPTDMPNIFVEALTVADGRLHSEVREIVVPPEPRVANVEVLPSAERYRPGEEATVRLKLTDIHGNPFVGNTVLSVYDASLEYIAASAIPEIRSFFWNVRRHHNVHNDFTFGQYSGPIQLPDEIAMQYLFSGSEFGGGGGGMGGFGGGFPEREVFFNIRRGGSARMLEADSM